MGSLLTAPHATGSTAPAADPWRITHERGPMTRQIRAATLEAGGEAAWRALLGSVSKACRARFEHPIGYFEWVESELALELHEAWIAQRGEELMAQRGVDAAREILQRGHRWLLRLATPGLLIQAMPRLFHLYYRGGELRVAALETGHASLELRGSGYFESWYRDALPAWASEALRSTGLREVRVEHLPPGPSEVALHGYEIRWRG